MSLKSIISDINQYANSLPPVEQWSPSHVGAIDISIDDSGDWFSEGSAFSRQNLVLLLSSVLVFEENDYWLKMPQEKLKISVEDVPFIITNWHWLDNKENTTMVLITNIDEQVLLTKDKTIKHKNGLLYIPVQRGLLAKVHRNVFYQWAEFGTETIINNQVELTICSDGQRFSLGSYAI